jgi:hypothetical protein
MRALSSIRERLAKLAASMPKPLPESGTTTEAVDLLFAVGLVLRRLEDWAHQRPGFEPMGEPTVWHQPDAADRRMAAQCPQLAALAEAHLVHAPGVLDARLSALFSQYQAAGIPDEGVDAALADVRERLAAQTAGGERIPQWCSRFLNPIAGNSAAQSTEQ